MIDAVTTGSSKNADGETNEPGANSEWTNASILFEEREKAFGCIRQLVVERETIKDYRTNDQALEDLRAIFDKYLEVPSLLDHHIVELVTTLTDAACKILAKRATPPIHDKEKTETTSQVNTNEYDWFWKSPLPRILSAIYALSKVRGRKRVQKFLPHQVENLEPVLNCLIVLDTLAKHPPTANRFGVGTIMGGPQLWESLYTVWNWMEILGKVPFDCEVVIDASQIQELFRLATSSLSETGPTREMAASCLSRWLARPDLEESTFRTSFQEWSLEMLQAHVGKAPPMEGKPTTRCSVFTAMGILRTLVTILKISTAQRHKVLASMEPYWSLLQEISSSKTKYSNLLLRKYLVKWWTRLGVLYLPPKVASWRYQRGRRSLKENLQRQLQKNEQKQSADATTTTTTTTTKESSEMPPDPREAQDYFFFVPDQVEMAMGQVLASLQDASTAVRWSAAKGVGRITSRLPAICAEDVIDAILELFDDMEQDNDWHGACLSLAELARRGLLLPHRLKDVIPKIVTAIHYDVPRRKTSVGSHVRDAACYTYWALARAYSPEILRPFVPQLGTSVVVAFLFDREVNCRRAASAAFQEMVGRQGAQNFKNGIAILTAADYFSLGNRKNAFTTIAVEIAKYEEYQIAIIEHLYTVTLTHWDPAMRLLGSQSLNKLTPLNPQYMVDKVIPHLLIKCLDEKSVQVRHGATLGLAEIVLAFGDMETRDKYVSKELNNSMAEIIPIVEKKRLYRGRGGEQMRAAICRLIECLSMARIPLTVRQYVRLLDSLDACLPHPNEVIQEQAGAGLLALLRSYFPVSAKGPSARLQARVVDKYTKIVSTSINPAATRGFALALGCLPRKIVAPSTQVLDMTLTCLIDISHPLKKVGDDKDAETRTNALVSLSRVCDTVGLIPSQDDSQCVVAMTSEQIQRVFSAFLRSMGDYNTDQRGDVGSKCRLASMNGLVALATLVTSSSSSSSRVVGESTKQDFTTELCTHILGLLWKQFSEKLNFVRSEAAKCLLALLDEDSPVKPYILHRESLVDALSPPNPNQTLNWADASMTYPMVMKAAEVDDEYFDYVIKGLVLSTGGLTKDTTQNSSQVLIQWVRRANRDEKLQKLGKAFLGLFEKHQGEGRVILPLLKTIDMLLNRGCLEELLTTQGTFCTRLIDHLRIEGQKSRDVKRLSSIVSVSTGLIATAESSPKALQLAIFFLIHEFPRVRSLSAEKLYIRLMETNPELADSQHEGIQLLLQHDWESDVDLKDAYNLVRTAFGIQDAIGDE